MPVHVVASVTSPPTDVMLKLNNTKVKISRDNTGAWKGSADYLLPTTFPLEFRAVGDPGAKWTLEIKFSTGSVEGQTVKDYKKDGVIPDGTMMSLLKDNITL